MTRCLDALTSLAGGDIATNPLSRAGPGIITKDEASGASAARVTSDEIVVPRFENHRAK